jgi:DNA-directed RNA polymerase specialized sigma24 family protein
MTTKEARYQAAVEALKEVGTARAAHVERETELYEMQKKAVKEALVVGLSYADIAKHIGLTRQAVRQMKLK